ncbi:hypothetical protein AVEN_92561-1 [Araneus ventricosus]|uniref:Uncharacterized protein n=1 Tax=Araneus ventricosus TaxID=182803 RepID=A0A4Y2AIB6_ARAVE|nr:hypothetical protein AVEN_92561-1 [Araneus ventricosus]
MERTTPELASLLSKLPYYTSGRIFGPDVFSVHQTRLCGGSSVESGFVSGAVRPRSRDFTTRPPRTKPFRCNITRFSAEKFAEYLKKTMFQIPSDFLQKKNMFQIPADFSTVKV